MQNSTEITTLCSLSPIPTHHFILRLTSALAGLSGNTLLLVGLVKDPLKCFRNSSSYFILNLCVSDTLVCLGETVILFGRNTCINGVNVYIFFHLPVYVSFFSIATMAFDRYMSSVHPLKYKIIVTRKFTLRLILLQWLFYMCSVVLEFFYEKWLLYPRCLVAMIIILSAVMMYVKATYALKKSSKALRRMSGYSSSVKQFHEIQVVNEKRFLTTLLMVSFITVSTLCPLVIYDISSGRRYFENERLPEKDRDDTHMWLVSLFFVNFCINPFLYSWRLTSYRKTFLVILKRLI